MQLAGWNFSILEGHESKNAVGVIDLKVPHFSKAQELALQQYKPGSTIVYSRASPEDELNNSMAFGTFRQWIPIQASDSEHEKQTFPDLWPNVETVNFAPE